jgi:cytochrome c
MKTLAILAPLALLAGCGSAPSGEETSNATATSETVSTTTASTDAAPASYAQCGVCHKVEKDGGNGLGPNLHGIIGKKAAQVAGFSYSPAMKASGLAWDEATLDKFIESPRGLVAGTKMSYAGLKDAKKRKEIIAWLKKNS